MAPTVRVGTRTSSSSHNKRPSSLCPLKGDVPNSCIINLTQDVINYTNAILLIFLYARHNRISNGILPVLAQDGIAPKKPIYYNLRTFLMHLQI